MNVLQTLEDIFTFLLLLANRFPFVAVSIAFAVNKEVSEQKTQNKTTVEPFTKLRENASDASSVTDFCFQLEFGVVYSCLEDKMYKARRGQGAFCNDEPIQVSDVKGNAARTRGCKRRKRKAWH